MQRRRFLTQAAAAAGAGLAAAGLPAVAQGTPSVRWRMSTGWPKSLDEMYGSADALCKRVSELTEGKFEIRAFPGGELVPYAQNMEAVSNGTIECNHVLATAHIGTNTAVAFDTGLSFGMNARQHNAWVQRGGGLELLREMYKKHGIVNFVCGNVGVQMGGWFRKEIKSLADLQGLKMRVGGIGGMVLTKLGAIPQQIPPGDIYPSLEKGTIDAAEWIGPYDDEKLGLNKVAPFYYSPGWWEGSASITTMVNEKAWNDLPAPFKAAFETACNEQTLRMNAAYDALNPPALRRLVAAGAKLNFFPKDVMDAAYKTSQELWVELADKNPDFAKIYPEWRKFQEGQVAWFRVAESALDNFTFNAVSRSSK
ncbi:TRAP transporter substrate-binding protein [Pusillimonas noertemannii]|uniref:TRAP-type mannitol/chloroaromatic compound transport system substrate-binding protein n=3 Tax=Pusillimonas noertemannii TaxID=305977 RepID=A0A2U1CGY1_9BURK|nr:TRAP transporter substrate-binding protein [Pusillimonas noertemannii]NYT70417.1 TRAP transporter substrate-binding protein [Pusillimonas noertemannii]PVY60159.1 TRAP-type mannitol/chloroaromatic compound transport system substrate-binding protein [Pusillimonas noertemannii]TFL08626.1 ABC transporter substrate-binding protein [Pusillimonas noertemannii]